jgi:hypothetical protein
MELRNIYGYKRERKREIEEKNNRKVGKNHTMKRVSDFYTSPSLLRGL